MLELPTYDLSASSEKGMALGPGFKQYDDYDFQFVQL